MLNRKLPFEIWIKIQPLKPQTSNDILILPDLRLEWFICLHSLLSFQKQAQQTANYSSETHSTLPLLPDHDNDDVQPSLIFSPLTKTMIEAEPKTFFS